MDCHLTLLYALFSLPFFPAEPGQVFYTLNDIRLAFVEPFEIDRFDKLRQGYLPRFLFFIRDFSEFARIEPQFSCHLDLCIRKMVSPTHFDPNPIFLRNKVFLCHNNLLLDKI